MRTFVVLEIANKFKTFSEKIMTECWNRGEEKMWKKSSSFEK